MSEASIAPCMEAALPPAVPSQSSTGFENSVGEKYEITIGPRLGPGPADAEEGRALIRIVREGDGFIEYDADPRQALCRAGLLDSTKSQTIDFYSFGNCLVYLRCRKACPETLVGLRVVVVLF